MTELTSVEDFYKSLMNDIEKKFYDVPDKDIIQKITPLFNKIKQKRKKIDKLKHYIKRSEKIIQNEKIPHHIIIKITSGKNKLINELKKFTHDISKIEKENYAKVVILTNMFMFDKIKDCDKFEEEVHDITENIEILFLDLEYWINVEEWDYVEEFACKLNQEEIKKIGYYIPSPLEVYYNYCRIS